MEIERARLLREAPSIVRQLHAIWITTPWSAQDLLDRSTIGCDRTGLGRKLRGQQSVDAVELEQIAGVLGVRVVVVPREAA